MNTDFEADDLVTDTAYEHDTIFASSPHEETGSFDRLVKVRSVSTHESGKTSVNEYLSIEHMRTSTLGGHYASERFSIPLPANRAERTELLFKFAAILGFDITID